MKNLAIILTFLIIPSISKGQVKIIAHRGYSYLAPENTVAAARLAWKAKADAVEVDIYLTGDGKIICSHDRTTKRTTGKDFLVPETDSKQLRKLDAGSFMNPRFKGEKIPFLKEIIRTVPKGKELVVEIKCGPEILPTLKETILRYGKNKKFVFICFSLETIVATKKMFTGNECYWLCAVRPLLEAGISRVTEAGIEGVSLLHQIIDREVMRKAGELDIEVYSWTVDNPEEAIRLVELGVKGITTNRPGWLREQIHASGR